MLLKNQDFGISNDTTIVIFKGDVLTSSCVDGKLPLVYLSFTDYPIPQKIGTPFPELEGKGKEEVRVDILFVFDNTESIDVLIKAAKKAKTDLTEKIKSNGKG